jgi:hypothetical protein
MTDALFCVAVGLAGIGLALQILTSCAVGLGNRARRKNIEQIMDRVYQADREQAERWAKARLSGGENSK